jgi:hypothetical protein
VRSFYDWLRGHPLVVDSMLALLLILLGVSVGAGLREVGVVEGALFAIAMSAPVAVRRRYPVGAFAVVVIVGGLEAARLLPRARGAGRPA